MAFNGQQGLQVPELGTDDEPNYAQYGLAQYRKWWLYSTFNLNDTR